MNIIPPSYIPVISGDWSILFRPEKYSSYVNDHTIIRGHDGKWHLYGCAQIGKEINPEMERYLVHGSTESLNKPMAEHRPVIDDGRRAWAPGAIRVGNHYYMYYGPAPTMMAHSIDCHHWMGNPVWMHGTPIDAAHRDHMVTQLTQDTWLMYAVGVKDGLGCVSVHVSNDMQNWRFVQYAFRIGGVNALKPAWGAIESPYVIEHQGWWYLFITYTDCSQSTYQNTLVFRSLNPYDFGTYTEDDSNAKPIANLKAHAAEIIFDESTQGWHITACGWRGFDIPHEGCVSIARLDWIRE